MSSQDIPLLLPYQPLFCLLLAFSYTDYLHSVRVKLSNINRNLHKTFSFHGDGSDRVLENICKRKFIEILHELPPCKSLFNRLPYIYDFRLKIEISIKELIDYSTAFQSIKTKRFKRALVVDELILRI